MYPALQQFYFLENRSPHIARHAPHAQQQEHCKHHATGGAPHISSCARHPLGTTAQQPYAHIGQQ